MRRLIGLYIISFLVLLGARTKVDEEVVESPPTSVTFPRPVQILMPNDLCDNLQSTLQYWVKEVLAAPYPYRQQWTDKVNATWTDMQAAGCV